jgi:hypothetical protein
MTPLAAVLVVAFGALALVAPQEAPQEKPKVPKDSVELTVIGCLKGRVLRTVENRQVDVESGPYVGARSFHLASKKQVSEQLKKEQGHLVEVTGLVKRSSLDDKGVSAGRVAIGGGSPVAGTRSIPSPADNVIVMDVSSVRMRASSCTAQ